MYFEVYQRVYNSEAHCLQRQLVFSQLERAQANYTDQVEGIGEQIISPNVAVQGDFEVRCMWYGTVPVPVGEAICLHTAFLANDFFVRVDLTDELHLDLIFSPEKGEDTDEDAFW